MENKHYWLSRCSWLCLWLNCFLMCIKLFGGHVYGSRALFADGIHSLLDVSADLFVLYTVRMLRLPSDDCHAYGYHRYETLGNIVISILLIMAAYYVTVDATYSLNTDYTPMSQSVVWVALLSILLNEASYQYVKQKAKLIRSDLLMSTAVHQRADAATSLIVLLSAVASRLQVGYADTVGAILIAGLIAYYAVPSLFTSVGELLDKGLSLEKIASIKSVIQAVEGVESFHFLRSRRMAEKGYIDVHIVVASRISVSEGHYISDRVREAVMREDDIMDVTVHVDYEDDQHACYMLPSRSQIEAWVRGHISYSRLVIHYQGEQVHLEIYEANQLIQKLHYPTWLSGCQYYRLSG